MSAAVLGLGTLLQLSDGGSPATFTTIAEVTNISINGSRDSIDVTSHDSLQACREFIAGLVNGGEVQLTLNFLPQNATHTDLTTNIKATSSIFRTYRIVWPDFGTSSFTGTVNTGTDVWTTAAHSWSKPQPIRFSTSGTLPTSTPQIVAGNTYFAGVASTTTFTVHQTAAAATAGTGAIDFTAAGSGTHTVTGGTSWTFSACVVGVDAAAMTDKQLTATPKFKVNASISISP
jgi:predicted secreted protein